MKTDVSNINQHPSGQKLAQMVVLLLLVCCMTGISLTASAQTGYRLDFNSPVLESGSAGTDGAVYRFSNIDVDMDALVTINGRSDALVYVSNMDMTGAGFDKAFQPMTGYNNGTTPGAVEWWMEFQIKFVQHGTVTPVSLGAFNVSGVDIDGNGQYLHEYAAFYGLNSYILEDNSALNLSDVIEDVNGTPTVVGKRFDGPTANFTNIDTGATAVMVTNHYVNTSGFRVRVGGVTTDVSGAAERMNSIYFKEFNYATPEQTLLSLRLKTFQAKENGGSVQLTWTATEKNSFNHYILERSIDGREFNQISIIFPAEQAPSSAYHYSDNVKGISAGIIYYRLQLVNNDLSYSYSGTQKVSLATKANVTIRAYPNPAASQLRVTLPEQWKNKAVAFVFYDISGNLVKRLSNSHPADVQTLNISDFHNGIYFLEVSCGSEKSTTLVKKS